VVGWFTKISQNSALHLPDKHNNKKRGRERERERERRRRRRRRRRSRLTTCTVSHTDLFISRKGHATKILLRKCLKVLKSEMNS
jgi:hypothetical protein